jgi:hypothetical protein
MRPNRLQNALASLGDAIREVNAAIEEMRREHDPLASHIFVSRRLYQKQSDTKSGKRHHLSARLRWQQACDLGFRGDLGEWERLMARRLGVEGRERDLNFFHDLHALSVASDAHSGSRSKSLNAIHLNLASISVARFRCAFARSRLPICAS